MILHVSRQPSLNGEKKEEDSTLTHACVFTMSSRQNMQDSMASVTLGQYEDLEAEYKACQQQLRSKDEALKIFQEQLRNSDINNQKLQQEINQLRSQLARSHPVSSTGTSATSSSSVSVVNHDLREKYISQLEESQVYQQVSSRYHCIYHFVSFILMDYNLKLSTCVVGSSNGLFIL